MRLAHNFNLALWPVGREGPWYLDYSHRSLAVWKPWGQAFGCFALVFVTHCVTGTLISIRMSEYLNEESVQPMQQCSTGDGILGRRVRQTEASGRAWAVCFGYAGLEKGGQYSPHPFFASPRSAIMFCISGPVVSTGGSLTPREMKLSPTSVPPGR